MNGNLTTIIQFVYVRLYYSPETVYCLSLSRMARMEMEYNLKKSWPTFSSSQSELIEFMAQNLALMDLSMKIYHRSSSRVQRSI